MLNRFFSCPNKNESDDELLIELESIEGKLSLLLNEEEDTIIALDEREASCDEDQSSSDENNLVVSIKEQPGFSFSNQYMNIFTTISAFFIKELPNGVPNLDQDILFNYIVKNNSYKHVLSKLRRTCQYYNDFIENTDAGKLAREANDLEDQIQDKINEEAGRPLYRVAGGMLGGAISGVIGSLSGAMGGMYMAQKYYRECELQKIFFVYHTYCSDEVNAYNYSVNLRWIGGMALAGGLVIGTGGLVAGALTRGLGLFCRNSNSADFESELKEKIKQIREPLAMPYPPEIEEPSLRVSM